MCHTSDTPSCPRGAERGRGADTVKLQTVSESHSSAAPHALLLQILRTACLQDCPVSQVLLCSSTAPSGALSARGCGFNPLLLQREVLVLCDSEVTASSSSSFLCGPILLSSCLKSSVSTHVLVLVLVLGLPTPQSHLYRSETDSSDSALGTC